MAVPTIGLHGVHAVQLSPKLRKLLHHRAVAEARREAAPVLAADRAALRIPKQEYRTNAAANKGATDAVASSLASALASLGDSGLKGHYRQETAQGLRDQRAAALAALPYLNAIAGEERAKGMTEARTQLAQDRGAMLHNAAKGFNELLGSARDAGATTEKERDEHREAHQQEVAENQRQHLQAAKKAVRGRVTKNREPVENAFHVALTGYKALVEHQGEETKNGNEIHPPKTNADWEQFVTQVEKEAGQGNRLDAEAAVKKLRERLAKEEQAYGGLGRTLAKVIP